VSKVQNIIAQVTLKQGGKVQSIDDEKAHGMVKPRPEM
jgi:hypothetical protein